MDAGVIPVSLGKKEVLLSGMEQGLTGEGLSVSQALRQGLAPGFGQQQQADDAQQGAAGEDHMMQEVALLVVELHDGCSEHAKAGTRQDQAQTSTPDDSRSDFSTKEYAEGADGVRREHANDGEGHRELPVQSVSQNCVMAKAVLPN